MPIFVFCEENIWFTFDIISLMECTTNASSSAEHGYA